MSSALATQKVARATGSPPRRKVTGAVNPTRSISISRKVRVRTISSTRRVSTAVTLVIRRVTEAVGWLASGSRTVGAPSAGVGPVLRFSTTVASASATSRV
jgi:hypothetical protein